MGPKRKTTTLPKGDAAVQATNTRRKGKAALQATKSRRKGKAALQATNTPRKGKAALQATNTPRKGKAALQATNTPRKGKATLQATNTLLAVPMGPGLLPADYDSEEDEHNVPDRKSAMANAQEIKNNLEVQSEDAYRSLIAFLERNGLHADNPYKDAMQKLLNGDASVITREIRGKIFEYVDQTFINLTGYLVSLLDIPNWDDEIASLIVKAIKETHQKLEVCVVELEDIACLARSIMSEPIKEFQVAKGKFVRECIISWLIGSNDFFDNQKSAEEWIKNPTASLTTIDPEETSFKIPRSVNQ